MSLIVNNQEIGSSIKLNNTDLSEIVFNGVSVWQAIKKLKRLPSGIKNQSYFYPYTVQRFFVLDNVIWAIGETNNYKFEKNQWEIDNNAFGGIHTKPVFNTSNTEDCKQFFVANNTLYYFTYRYWGSSTSSFLYKIYKWENNTWSNIFPSSSISGSYINPLVIGVASDRYVYILRKYTSDSSAIGTTYYVGEFDLNTQTYKDTNYGISLYSNGSLDSICVDSKNNRIFAGYTRDTSKYYKELVNNTQVFVQTGTTPDMATFVSNLITDYYRIIDLYRYSSSKTIYKYSTYLNPSSYKLAMQTDSNALPSGISYTLKENFQRLMWNNGEKDLELIIGGGQDILMFDGTNWTITTE